MSAKEKLAATYKQTLTTGTDGIMPGKSSCPQAAVVLAPQFFINPTTTDDAKGQVIGGTKSKVKR